MSQFIEKLSSNKAIDRICRVCLADDKNDMVPIFAVSECDEANLIYNKIMHVACVNINPADCFPRYICFGCKTDLETALNFKTRCEESENLLKKIKADIVARVTGESCKTIIDVKHESYGDTSTVDVSFDGTNNDNYLKEFEINKVSRKIRNKQFCCKICKKVYKLKKSYIVHKKNAHKSDDSKREIYAITGIGKNRVYHCIRCNYSSEKGKRVEVHFRTHSGEKPHSCDVCSSTYSQLSTLIRHKRTIHSVDTPFTCELCCRQFKLLASLKRHQITHEANLPHKCKICSKAFRWKHNRDDHIKRHSKKKSLACEKCGRLFVSKVDLLNHLLIHKRDTVFNCDVCSFKTHVKTYLKRHLWTHTGEGRCACEICGKVFSKRGNLNAHKLLHSNERAFECEFCNKKYRQKCVLKKHVLNCHDDKNKI